MHLLVNLVRHLIMSLEQQTNKNCFNCSEWLSSSYSLNKIISILIKTSLPNRLQNDYTCVNWHKISSPRRIQIGPS
jgi:hypothetical protein